MLHKSVTAFGVSIPILRVLLDVMFEHFFGKFPVDSAAL